jgi:hypothetical protein
MSTTSPKVDETENNELCILIEGPKWGDAVFYGRWLILSTRVDDLWKEMAAEDPSFRKLVDEVVSLPARVDFGLNASILLFKLLEKYCTLVIEPADYDAEAVYMMAQMGFFTVTRRRYQMTLPTEIDRETVKRAMLNLADLKEVMWQAVAQDHRYNCVNPFSLVCMPRSAAVAWQRLLGRMDEDERLAERSALLAASGNRVNRESICKTA